MTNEAAEATVLHVAADPQTTLADALARCPMTGGVALLAAPQRYHVAHVATDGCRTADGIVALDPVFEARIFTPDAELRWLNEDDGVGRAVLLTEDPDLLPGGFPERPSLEFLDVLPVRYLLWGAVVGTSDGWSALATERIGTVEVPMTASANGRVRLAGREYVAIEPEHGNAYVAEERLVALESYDPQGEPS